MRAYELMMIINNSLLQDERDALIKEIKEEIAAHAMKITSEDDMGERELAYKINGSTLGYYVLYNIEGDGKAIKEITKALNFKKNLWRFMFVGQED